MALNDYENRLLLLGRNLPFPFKCGIFGLRTPKAPLAGRAPALDTGRRHLPGARQWTGTEGGLLGHRLSKAFFKDAMED
jgi:hypothetical protein